MALIMRSMNPSSSRTVVVPKMLSLMSVPFLVWAIWSAMLGKLSLIAGLVAFLESKASTVTMLPIGVFLTLTTPSCPPFFIFALISSIGLNGLLAYWLHSESDTTSGFCSVKRCSSTLPFELYVLAKISELVKYCAPTGSLVFAPRTPLNIGVSGRIEITSSCVLSGVNVRKL